MRDIQPGWHAERHVKCRGSGNESALHIDHVRANDEGRGVGDGGQGYRSYRHGSKDCSASLGTQVGAGAAHAGREGLSRALRVVLRVR